MNNNDADRAAIPESAASDKPEQKREGVLKHFWRKIRVPLARSALVKSLLVGLITNYLRLVNLTNPMPKAAKETIKQAGEIAPFIVTFWHGQHLMGPFVRPKSAPTVAMFSRSADAELNAKVAERLGLETVRGSGGRAETTRVEKGGARALLTLKNALKNGKSAAMIADIAHGTAREAGEGIILLAKLSGRPIIPTAYASTRKIVLEKTWDKTTIPLPFGRAMVVAAEPVWVPADANADVLEAKRQELTQKLNEATAQAAAALEKAS